MRVEEIKVYTFNELSDQAKNNAIELMREKEDYEFIGVQYNDYYLDELKENGFHVEVNEFRYSLNNCQGDGVSFLCHSFNEEVLFNSFLETNKKYNRIKNIIINHMSYEFKINTQNYMYVHEKSVYFEFSVEWYNEKHPLLSLEIDNFCFDFTNYIENIRLDLCTKFEKMLYDEMEFLISDENITEKIINNEYEFYEDGAQY